MKHPLLIACLVLSPLVPSAAHAQSEPFRMQWEKQLPVKLDFASSIGAYQTARSALMRVSHWPAQEYEIEEPPEEVAATLALIEVGASRRQTEELLGSEWREMGGDVNRAGYWAEYIHWKFPGVMIIVPYQTVVRRRELPELKGRTVHWPVSEPELPVIERPRAFVTRWAVSGDQKTFLLPK